MNRQRIIVVFVALGFLFTSFACTNEPVDSDPSSSQLENKKKNSNSKLAVAEIDNKNMDHPPKDRGENMGGVKGASVQKRLFAKYSRYMAASCACTSEACLEAVEEKYKETRDKYNAYIGKNPLSVPSNIIVVKGESPDCMSKFIKRNLKKNSGKKKLESR